MVKEREREDIHIYIYIGSEREGGMEGGREGQMGFPNLGGPLNGVQGLL